MQLTVYQHPAAYSAPALVSSEQNGVATMQHGVLGNSTVSRLAQAATGLHLSQNPNVYPTITRFSSAASAKFERMLALRQRSDTFLSRPDCTT